MAIDTSWRPTSTHRLSRTILIVSLIANLFLIPLLANSYLMFTYRETLANWMAKVIHPDTVFIGDSITASGRLFNSARTINLGTNGLHTDQIAVLMTNANSYSPKHIAIMAGTNDAIENKINPAEIFSLWDRITGEPKIVITLSPHTRIKALNERIDGINAIVTAAAAKRHRPVISLSELNGQDGLIQTRYTVDGVHLSPAALAIWRAKLSALGI
jgi:lysophospholipase L1-like esterase